MFKFVVFCVLLWREIDGTYGNTEHVSTDTPNPIFFTIFPSKINDAGKQNGIFYWNDPLLGRAGSIGNFNSIGKGMKSDYLTTIGIGAHKVHRRQLDWNKARQICISEGGHLAVIRTESEEKIVLQMMLELSLNNAWLGFHDQFQEGDWISVFDESLGETGWARWSKKLQPNPDNYQGKQHCAQLLRDGGGMDDDNCNIAKPFVCKISTF